MSANRWTPKQVLVAVAEGKASRDGYVNAAYPGLSIHRTRDLGWIITHLESGAAMLAGCPTRKYVETAIRTLGPAADWTQPIEALRHRRDLFALAQTFYVAWDKWVQSNAKPMPARVARV
jgi:hypothetical protein